MGEQIENLLHETRKFPPSDDFRAGTIGGATEPN